jgi:hypothetical protein
MEQRPTVGVRSAVEVLNFLPPDLIEVLAGLCGTSRAQANATIQLLPFGSRAALESMDPPLAEPGPAVEGSEYRTLELTDFGFEVIAEARSVSPNRPRVATDWTSRADELKRMVAELRAT